MSVHPDIAAVLAGERRWCVVTGDCLDVLRGLTSGATSGVDAVITDPPYGIAYNHEDRPQSKHAPSNRRQIAPVTGDEKPFDPSPWLGFKYVVLWGATCYYDRLPPQRAWLAWDKVTRNGLNLRIAEWEAAWAKPLRRSQCFRHLWSGAYRDSDRGYHVHPTQKPVPLMAWCMERVGVPADALVLDPYCGSGTTGVAALKTGRRFIGIEIDEHYANIARERIAKAEADVALLAKEPAPC